jgi:hypothetical protein
MAILTTLHHILETPNPSLKKVINKNILRLSFVQPYTSVTYSQNDKLNNVIDLIFTKSIYLA